MIQKILAKNLKRLRKLRGYTQESLAEKSGLSVDAIQTIEQGTRWPHASRIMAIAKAIGVHPSEFFKK